MSSTNRIEHLKDRHAGLEAAITAEVNRPHPDDTTVAQMKREKLRIKDEIAAMQRQPD